MCKNVHTIYLNWMKKKICELIFTKKWYEFFVNSVDNMGFVYICVFEKHNMTMAPFTHSHGLWFTMSVNKQFKYTSDSAEKEEHWNEEKKNRILSDASHGRALLHRLKTCMHFHHLFDSIVEFHRLCSKVRISAHAENEYFSSLMNWNHLIWLLFIEKMNGRSPFFLGIIKSIWKKTDDLSMNTIWVTRNKRFRTSFLFEETMDNVRDIDFMKTWMDFFQWLWMCAVHTYLMNFKLFFLIFCVWNCVKAA